MQNRKWRPAKGWAFVLISLIMLYLLDLPLVQTLQGSAAKQAGPPAHELSDSWMSGQKDGFGTAYTYDYKQPDSSRTWFTLTHGVLSECFYPTLDTPQLKEASLSVLGPDWSLREERDFQVRVSRPDPLALLYQVEEVNQAHAVRILKTVFTDPEHNSVVMSVQVTAPQQVRIGLEVVPHLGGTGLGNEGEASPSGLDFQGRNTHLSVRSDASIGGFAAMLHPAGPAAKEDWSLRRETQKAGPGEVVGRLLFAGKSFRLIFSFGRTGGEADSAAQSTLEQPQASLEARYTSGWHDYLAALSLPGGLKLTPEAQASLMLIKAAEDKTTPGAIIAGPVFPWGLERRDKPDEHGYNLVWPRDLYDAGIALWAWGDRTTAREALGYLAQVQRHDGGFWQNTRVDGTPYWMATQKDETADAILLAELVAPDQYWPMVERAANFLAQSAPDTEQERWEEQHGYSPATLASEIAGLRSAARQAQAQGQPALAAHWREVADAWDRNVENWTYTTTGPLGTGYYLRISSSGTPNRPDEITLANNAGSYDARAVVDPGFLELVRLGVRSPHDPHILSTLKVVDHALKVETPLGPAWYRYNHDAYGDRGKDGVPAGRLWPLLTGERGLYELAAGNEAGARAMLQAMVRFANPAGLLAEQIWQESGSGTESATPLIWSQAEYLQLEASVQRGHVVGVIKPG